jgi:hypothetical protein
MTADTIYNKSIFQFEIWHHPRTFTNSIMITVKLFSNAYHKWQKIDRFEVTEINSSAVLKEIDTWIEKFKLSIA